MDLLGVGPLELVFILIIIFLVLGPEDLVTTGRKLGKFLNTVRKSELWQGITQVSREVRSLPNTLMREANLEEARELKKDLQKDLDEVRKVAEEFDAEPAKKQQPAQATGENTIAPPSLTNQAEDALAPEASEPTPEETSEED